MITMQRKLSLLVGVFLAVITPQAIARDPPTSVKPEVLGKLGQHGVGKIVFVKRATNGADHYYTEYLTGNWAPNGSICTLDLKTGTVQELVSQLKGGMFERFDVSFDAKRVVFAYRATQPAGHRIYEINVDGTGLRQLTFPPPDEDERIKKFGSDRCTDDMQPCYLPDGGIVFICRSCVSKHTHLALKVQHGVVPVEDDGSANFVVPAEANIFFQVLDENYMAVQTERTYAKSGNVAYLPAKSLGSHTSVLVAMLSKGKVKLADPKNAERAAKLAEVHKDLKLAPEELLKITNWIDTNGQYYGTYWGRKNLKYKDHPQFRIYPTFETATSMTSPVPEEQR
ncbi:MAG: hypothetical protein NTW21_41560 [Verrucomicrobia bacterium]|nr:hypothetical protein [Verrucomicrobiota bacterium]